LENSLNFLSFTTPHVLGYECFLNVAKFSLENSHQFCFIIWVFLIVLHKIDSFWHNRCSLSKVLNWNLNLKFYQMDFGLNFLTFKWMKKEQLAIITMVLNGKHKYFFQFWLFFLLSNILYSSLVCDYTLLVLWQRKKLFGCITFYLSLRHP